MKTKHHLFSYKEVRRAVVDIFGEPKTPDDHKKIQEITRRMHKKIPVVFLEWVEHQEIHKKRGHKF